VSLPGSLLKIQAGQEKIRKITTQNPPQKHILLFLQQKNKEIIFEFVHQIKNILHVGNFRGACMILLRLWVSG